MQDFFWADPHLGHGSHKGGIIKMMSRVVPGTRTLFSSIEEHDTHMIEACNSVVSRDDRLHIIGDFAWRDPAKYRARLKCKQIHLITGNHDQRAKCANIFSTVSDLKSFKIRCQGFSQLVVLCHYPLAFWEKSYAGSIHLYGHCHGMVERRLELAFPGRRAMDVGVDNLYDFYGNYAPIVSDEVVCRVLERCDGHDDVAYYRAYQYTRYTEKCL